MCHSNQIETGKTELVVHRGATLPGTTYSAEGNCSGLCLSIQNQEMLSI